MNRFWSVCIALTLILPLAACRSAAGGTSGPVSAASASARVDVTYVPSQGIGNIAVRIASPQTPRYEDGAGVIVVVPPIFTDSPGFLTDPDLTGLGLISVSLLWPGKTDDQARVRSGGEFDYGGENSIQALRDVIRFASGINPDKGGHYLSSLTAVPPHTDEVGLYAFGDAGIAAVNVLSSFSNQMQGVQYFVGRENPTVDTISSLEIGYWGSDGKPVYNPMYNYPKNYGSGGVTLDYSTIRWDATYRDAQTSFRGLPYLDLDGSGTVSAGDYVFGGVALAMFGKRYFSAALTQALIDKGALTLADWPADLATPQEAAQAWQPRQILGQFQNLRDSDVTKDLKVMLVFAKDDHAQVAADKPHIHQAFQGFRFEARLWVRLNPDRAYVRAFIPQAGLDFPDNPANSQPQDWMQISDWAYPGQGAAAQLVPLAALAEMADRAHAGQWSENLGQVLYAYPPAP